MMSLIFNNVQINQEQNTIKNKTHYHSDYYHLVALLRRDQTKPTGVKLPA